MKIIGFVYNNGEGRRAKGEGQGGWSMVLKGDSCLLNGRKPMFIPEWTHELGMTPCLVLRVSRLGKGISERFAGRYYDAVAPGADFAALDMLRQAQAEGGSWTQAIGFDYSLALGEWGEPSAFSHQFSDYLMTPEEAIAEASRWMTIRQGDLIYIQAKQTPKKVEKEDIISVAVNGEEKLYCKIK
ncbi:MAG: hypothetical protein IJ814_08635 [Paludibacteraceae bacterium]|nr:hypothetical protein [Paludibacteraceae bacterium]